MALVLRICFYYSWEFPLFVFCCPSILCFLQFSKFFFPGLARVVTYGIVPFVTRNWIDMISAVACLNIELDYGYGLTDKLPAKVPAKELR